MGFQSSDIIGLGRELLGFEGVSGAWILAPSDSEAVLWVTVRDFDDKAALSRRAVYQAVERFVDSWRDAINSGAVIFDYFVLVDDPELGEAQIPSAARALAA